MNHDNRTVTDFSPRWIVLLKKNQEAFSLKFNNLDHMLLSISRAKAAEYKVKVLSAK